MAALWDDPRIKRGMTEQLAKRRNRIAAGDKPLGWKVGFGAPAFLQKFRITAPLVGSLLQSGRLASGATASLRGWAKPIAEPEIAVTIGHDLAPGGDRAAAAAAIVAFTPAFELVDAHLPFDDPEAILVANIFQRHVVLGDADMSRGGGDTTGLVGRISRDGKETARTDNPEANTGNIVDIVRHVADLLGAFGERLKAGDIIITGSVVPPLMIEPAEKKLRFDLDPVGSVEVNFTR
jgi:2-keto-4-pentenoate hydratase